MFLPINQYYANAPPQKPIEIRKKNRKYKNAQTSGENTANQDEEIQVHSASVATTASSDELIATSSVSSSMNRSSENSNSNRI